MGSSESGQGKGTVSSDSIDQMRKGTTIGLFWSWNVIFLASMLLGFAPQLLPEVLSAARTGQIPTACLAYGLILTAIPLLAIAIGTTVLVAR